MAKPIGHQFHNRRQKFDVCIKAEKDTVQSHKENEYIHVKLLKPSLFIFKVWHFYENKKSVFLCIVK